jgi:hypothetical protein
MPDPLTIVTGTISLVGHAIQGVQAISSYVGKYKIADLTIASMTTECSTIRLALSQIQRLILDKKILQSPEAGDEHASYILDDFQRVLGACSFTFAALNQRLASLDLQGINKYNESTFMAKVKAVWNEDEMSVLRHNIRGLSDAISLLLTVSQA